jgi:fibronectin type 3 domain-containing protein
LPEGRYAVAAQEWSGLESCYAVANSGVLTTQDMAPPRPQLPRVKTSETTHTVLQWPELKSPSIDHYNVYASTDDICVPARATLVGSPKKARFVDWGITPAATYRYRITVVDKQGNESLPSLELVVATPAPSATDQEDVKQP